MSYAGNKGGVAGVPDDPERISGYELIQNYPNPCNPDTKIGFRTARQNLVILKVFDLLGREVATLVNQSLPRGSHEVTFAAGELTSGIYFYRLTAGSFTQTRKLLILR